MVYQLNKLPLQSFCRDDSYKRNHKTYSNILKDNFLNYKIDTINN